MTNLLASLSAELAAATDTAAASVVQVQARRRAVAGVTFSAGHVLVPGHSVDDDAVAVRRADGHTFDGAVVGRDAATGLAVVRVEGLDVPVATPGGEARPGHLALALGRTWSGGVFSTLASVVAVGGPLRTGRTTEIARVVRIGHAPHGALTGGALVDGAGHVLGVLTSIAIRGTTVVIPAAIAWASGQAVLAHGGTPQGFLGVSSMGVALSARQRADGRDRGLLVTGVVPQGPADIGGLLVGDIIVGFGGAPVADPEDLLARLRESAVGHEVAVTVVRGSAVEALTATVGERPRG